MENGILQSNLKLAGSDDLLAQKQFEIMLNSSNNRINNELSSIKIMINKLNEDIHEIKRQLSENASRARAAEPVPAASESAKAANPAEQNKAKYCENSQRPLYGDFKPEDVSVSKIFYFGNKKFK